VRNGSKNGYYYGMPAYRIVTMRWRDSGTAERGYFVRWQSDVYLDGELLGIAQAFTRRRSERRARKLAMAHERELARQRRRAGTAPPGARETIYDTDR